MAKLNQSQIRKLIKQQYRRAILKEANLMASELDKQHNNDPNKSGISLIKANDSTINPGTTVYVVNDANMVGKSKLTQIVQTLFGQDKVKKITPFTKDLHMGQQPKAYFVQVTKWWYPISKAAH